MTRSLDELLRAGEGASVAADSTVSDEVARVVRTTKAIADDRRRVRVRAFLIGVPAAAAAAVMLTAGAVGVDATINPDVVIPVHYTTDDGASYRCTVYIEGGSFARAGTTEIGKYLREQDWDGIGQRIYKRAQSVYAALEQSGRPPGVGADDLDEWAWSIAETDLTVGSVPEDLFAEGGHAASTSDCAGKLW